MELRKNCVYILFILTGIVNIIASKCFELNKAVGYGKYFNGEIMQTVGTIGFQQCQNMCNERTDCLSTNYNKVQRICELISTSKVSENTEERIDFVFTEKETPNVCSELQCKEGSKCLKTTKGTPVCLEESSSTNAETTSTTIETTSTPTDTTSTPDETTSTTASNGPCEIDCHDIAASTLSAQQVHQICPFGNEVSVTVRCIAGTSPWTVIQRRVDGSENFDRNWNEYKSGFGAASGEYWIGNDALHALTSSKSYSLHITIEDWSGNTAYAAYSSFIVGNQASDYQLTVSGYTGNAGFYVRSTAKVTNDKMFAGYIQEDSMSYSDGYSFSTKDKNPHTTGNGKTCTENHKSGWWHGHYVTWCAYANLNGVYGQRTNDMSTIYWWEWNGSFKPLKSCTMKIKRNT